MLLDLIQRFKGMKDNMVIGKYWLGGEDMLTSKLEIRVFQKIWSGQT